MALNTIKKGQSLKIVKDGSFLDTVLLRLTWVSDKDMDFDLSSIALKTDSKFPFGRGVSETHVCYFDQPNTPAMKSSGDDRGRDDDEASEEIEIDFKRLPSDCTHVHSIVTLYDAKRRDHHFGDVKSLKMEVIDPKDGTVIIDTEVTELKKEDTSLLFVSFEREDKGFRATAINEGYQKEIGDFFIAYGFQVD